MVFAELIALESSAKAALEVWPHAHSGSIDLLEDTCFLLRETDAPAQKTITLNYFVWKLENHFYFSLLDSIPTRNISFPFHFSWILSKIPVCGSRNSTSGECFKPRIPHNNRFHRVSTVIAHSHQPAAPSPLAQGYLHPFSYSWDPRKVPEPAAWGTGTSLEGLPAL